MGRKAALFRIARLYACMRSAAINRVDHDADAHFQLCSDQVQ